jgi:hypothetical protein
MEVSSSVFKILEIRKLGIAILSLSIGFTILQSYFFYGYPLGIGYPLFITALMASIAIFGWYRKSISTWSRQIIFWGISALFFACMVAVREDEILTFMNVNISLYSLALFASRGAFMSSLNYLPILRTLGLPFAFLYNGPELVRNLRWSTLWKKKQLIHGLTVGIPLVLIYFILFSVGDLWFKDTFGGIWETVANWIAKIIPAELFGRILNALLILPFIAGLIHAGVHSMIFPYKPIATPTPSTQDGHEAYAPLYAACLAFIPFSFLQIQSIFKGHANIGVNLSYAEYAKDGYYALLLSAMLTLGILIYTGKRSFFIKNISSSIRWICFALLLQVGLLIGITFSRLFIYQEAYGLTLTRFYGYAVLIGLFGIFVWLGWRIYSHNRFRLTELPMVIWGLFIWAMINVMNPAGFVAASNLQSTSMIWTVDTRYLSQLSLDSLPSQISEARTGEEVRAIMDSYYWSVNYSGDPSTRAPQNSWFAWHMSHTLAQWAADARYRDFAK